MTAEDASTSSDLVTKCDRPAFQGEGAHRDRCTIDCLTSGSTHFDIAPVRQTAENIA
jgi:hypothetical protein